MCVRRGVSGGPREGGAFTHTPLETREGELSNLRSTTQQIRVRTLAQLPLLQAQLHGRETLAREMDSLLWEALVPREKQYPGVTALVAGDGLGRLGSSFCVRYPGPGVEWWETGGGGCCPLSPFVPATPALGAWASQLCPSRPLALLAGREMR